MREMRGIYEIAEMLEELQNDVLEQIEFYNDSPDQEFDLKACKVHIDSAKECIERFMTDGGW